MIGDILRWPSNFPPPRSSYRSYTALLWSVGMAEYDGLAFPWLGYVIQESQCHLGKGDCPLSMCPHLVTPGKGLGFCWILRFEAWDGFQGSEIVCYWFWVRESQLVSLRPTASQKIGPQAHSLKEMNSVNNLNELGSRFFPELLRSLIFFFFLSF